MQQKEEQQEEDKRELTDLLQDLEAFQAWKPSIQSSDSNSHEASNALTSVLNLLFLIHSSLVNGNNDGTTNQGNDDASNVSRRRSSLGAFLIVGSSRSTSNLSSTSATKTSVSTPTSATIRQADKDLMEIIREMRTWEILGGEQGEGGNSSLIGKGLVGSDEVIPEEGGEVLTYKPSKYFRIRLLVILGLVVPPTSTSKAGSRILEGLEWKVLSSLITTGVKEKESHHHHPHQSNNVGTAGGCLLLLLQVSSLLAQIDSTSPSTKDVKSLFPMETLLHLFRWGVWHSYNEAEVVEVVLEFLIRFHGLLRKERTEDEMVIVEVISAPELEGGRKEIGMALAFLYNRSDDPTLQSCIISLISLLYKHHPLFFYTNDSSVLFDVTLREIMRVPEYHQMLRREMIRILPVILESVPVDSPGGAYGNLKGQMEKKLGEVKGSVMVDQETRELARQTLEDFHA